jgi:hypothetical protein
MPRLPLNDPAVRDALADAISLLEADEEPTSLVTLGGATNEVGSYDQANVDQVATEGYHNPSERASWNAH